MPLTNISRTASMRKLSELLFAKDQGLDSDGESDVSTACEAEHSADEDGFVRCISEESTLTGSLPFSRCPSGAEPLEGSAGEAGHEEGAEWVLPRIPGCFGPPHGSWYIEKVIAVARDGSCSFVQHGLEGALAQAEEEESPVLAVARDGTCRFSSPTSSEREMLAVSPEGDCHFVRRMGGAEHMSYLNHLSYAPWELAEESSPVVLVSPAGTAWFFESQQDIDWTSIEDLEKTAEKN